MSITFFPIFENMKKLLLLLLFIPLMSISQTWSPTPLKGFNEPYVVELEGHNAEDIYKSASDWIKVTFPDADKVILSKTKNEQLKFQGISGISPNEVYVIINIQFRDSRYRVSPQQVQFHPSKVDFSAKYIYKKDGSIKKQNGKVLSSALNLFSSMENGIKENLNNTKDDW